jgi:hypothetical protein
LALVTTSAGRWFIDPVWRFRMTPQQLALEHIRKCINTADALRMMSSAVLVRDLKILLKMAESAIQDQSGSLGVRLTNNASTTQALPVSAGATPVPANTIVVEAP